MRLKGQELVPQLVEGGKGSEQDVPAVPLALTPSILPPTNQPTDYMVYRPHFS